MIYFDYFAESAFIALIIEGFLMFLLKKIANIAVCNHIRTLSHEVLVLLLTAVSGDISYIGIREIERVEGLILHSTIYSVNYAAVFAGTALFAVGYACVWNKLIFKDILNNRAVSKKQNIIFALTAFLTLLGIAAISIISYFLMLGFDYAKHHEEYFIIFFPFVFSLLYPLIHLHVMKKRDLTGRV